MADRAQLEYEVRNQQEYEIRKRTEAAIPNISKGKPKGDGPPPVPQNQGPQRKGK